MNRKEYNSNRISNIKKYWHKMPLRMKYLTISIGLSVILLIIVGTIVKTNIDNRNLSPQLRQFKKDGTLFIDMPNQISEDENHVAKIKGKTAPKAHVQIGYGIFGDTTTSDNQGNFILNYDDSIKEKTNIKIKSSINGKNISRIITVLPSPKIQKELAKKLEQSDKNQQYATKLSSLKLNGKSLIDAKSLILQISPTIKVQSQSNNPAIPTISNSDKVTDMNVNQSNTNVSVMLSVAPSDEEKKIFADKQRKSKKEKDEFQSKENYKKNMEAYEVTFQDYAIEYLIDKNTSTVYERTTDDSSISQSQFTGDMDTAIDFNLDGLQMHAYHHYAGSDAVAYFNNPGISNKATKQDPKYIKDKYFQSVNLPF